jgi:hypothetical protein
MGEVYRARDSRLNREVAVKVVPPSVAGNPEARARFERESRAVAALSHPNILAIYDVGQPPMACGRDCGACPRHVARGSPARASCASDRRPLSIQRRHSSDG